jgi:hypothetical protein
VSAALEEGIWDALRHPRGRGGQWSKVLGKVEAAAGEKGDPAVVSKLKAKLEPPPIVRRVKKLETTEAFRRGRRSLGYMRQSGVHGDEFMFDLATDQGFAGRPHAVSEEELQAHIDAGAVEMWRGTSDRSYADTFLTGTYYALALDTPIPTPSGWSTIGQIEAGDQVFDADGKPTEVVGVTPVFMDRPCYAVRFDDGSEIVADADHQWLVSTRPSREHARRWKNPDRRIVMGRARAMRGAGVLLREIGSELGITVDAAWSEGSHGGDRVVTTAEMAATIASRYAVANVAPLRLPDAALPIDPYVLGAWLGDGTAANATFTCEDEEIVWQIRAAGHAVQRRGESGYGCPRWQIFDLRRKLDSASLLDNKHVPSEYFRASAEQRRALICGLMDTDGTVSKFGQCEFGNANRALAYGMAELLASVGIKVRILCRDDDRRSRKPFFRVMFSTHSPVFRLRRKLDRQQLGRAEVDSKIGRHSVVEVRQVESVPVRCLEVASLSHLFVVGRAMIPTHNCGLGFRGNGIYTASGARAEQMARAYATAPPTRGIAARSDSPTVVRMALHRDAKVVEFEDAARSARHAHQAAMVVGEKSGGAGGTPDQVRAEVYRDPSRWALANGYDAVRVTQADGSDEHIVLNRTALLVSTEFREAGQSVMRGARHAA